jgi:dihydroflavonol-4-reductase
MKAFVTGGTGFFGTHLIQELDQAGWEIIALHRSRSDLTELKKCRRVQFTQGDVTDIESIRRGMPEGVDAVFHCAGSVGNLPHSQEKSRYAVNQTGTRNVVDVCKDKKIGRLIYTTTILTYDWHACRPLSEETPRNL